MYIITIPSLPQVHVNSKNMCHNVNKCTYGLNMDFSKRRDFCLLLCFRHLSESHFYLALYTDVNLLKEKKKSFFTCIVKMAANYANIDRVGSLDVGF